MSWRKPLKGLQAQAEQASGTMRDISQRLLEIAKRLSEEQAEELRFVAKMLDTQANLLVVQTASGDLATTGWASKIANLGVSFAIGVLGNLSTPIIQSGSEDAYHQVTAICEQAATEVSLVTAQVAGEGANEVHKELHDLQQRLVNFTSGFTTTRGAEVFPPAIYDATAGDEVVLSDVLTTVYAMREWMERRDGSGEPPNFYMPDANERVGSELRNAQIQIQRISAMRQVLAEESLPFSGLAANPTATANVSTSDPVRSVQDEARTDDSIS